MTQPVYLNLRVQLLALAFLGGIGAVVSLGIDASASHVLRSSKLPGDLRRAIDLSEVFAQGIGVTAILGTLFIVAQERRAAICGAILLTAVAGLTSNIAKQAVVRVRPHSQDKIQVVPRVSPNSNSPIATTDNDGVSEAVELVEVSFWDSRQRSFPSGHAATAWGLAIGLSLVFPRGVWLFVIFAASASLQRVVSGAHYPSDIFAGAAIAFATSSLLLSLRRVRQLFTLNPT